MASVLDPEVKRALAERVRYYNELGIYDFYRREPAKANLDTIQDAEILRESHNPARTARLDDPKIQSRDRGTGRREHFRSIEPKTRSRAWLIPSRHCV